MPFFARCSLHCRSVLRIAVFACAATFFGTLAGATEPLWAPAGAKIDDALRTKAGGRPILAEPKGYSYFYRFSTGASLDVPGAPATCPWAARALRGWAIAKGGSPAGYHIAVPKAGRFVVAIGFFGLGGPCDVVLDGKKVDTVEPVDKPLVKTYEAADLNGDGLLEVSCCHAIEEVEYTGSLNAVWVFSGVKPEDINADALVQGRYDVVPMYAIVAGHEESFLGHVAYPAVSASAQAKLQPMRPVPFDRDTQWPQVPDPTDIEIRGDLADRIFTYMDRWGFVGRDQKLAAGFLVDSGYEVTGRNIETFYMLGRLMRKEFDLTVPAEALLARQDSASRVPGSFVGGRPARTAFIWSQGCVLSGLMAAHEMTGDAKYLDAAGRLADWYDHYLNKEDLDAANYYVEEDPAQKIAKGQFTTIGGYVGQIGKGALEGMVWLYWRTKNPKYLEIAKQIAELNRKNGSAAWAIHGIDPAKVTGRYEAWHIHAALSTIRGFPWLYAATGDRSYLDDAVAACDRVFREATWGTGGVLEKIPWAGDVDPHDETCQTSDELQLSFLLGEFTGESRFYDRAELIYYNHIRYMQIHNGDFTASNRLPGTARAGDAWFCCGWWGGKALYETARHLYAASPTTVCVNGFMPSAANLRLAQGTVHIETEADIPKSGDVRLKLDPQGVAKFPVKIRVPSWATLQSVSVNGQAQAAQPDKGYVTLDREWKKDDVVDIRFDLPLRVVLDRSYDTLSTGRAVTNDGIPADARRVLVFRGPVILAQFTLSNGCDLSWAYTGDHPDLFQQDTVADVIDRPNWRFESNTFPPLTRIVTTPEATTLSWEYKPQPGWTLRRSAVVHATVPVRIDFAAELTAPSEEEAKAMRSFKLCGVRMRTVGFQDYLPARLLVGQDQKPVDAGAEPKDATVTLDNGYVQFRLQATDATADNYWSVQKDPNGSPCGLYRVPAASGTRFAASCTVELTGQSQFTAGQVAGSTVQGTVLDTVGTPIGPK